MLDSTDAVFILVGVLFVVGIIELSVRQKDAVVRLTVFCIAGAVCGIVGLINLGCIHKSSQTSSIGVIVNLNQYHGKGAHSEFDVRGNDGSLRHVNCDYSRSHLFQGETVGVQVLNYHSTLLHLVVLDGAYTGWILNEGDGSSGSKIAIGYGFFAALYAWVRRRYASKKTGESVTLPTD